MRQTTIINWSISSFFGWGVYGLNLVLNWAGDPDIEPVGSLPIDPNQIAVDALRKRRLEPFLADSAHFVDRLRQGHQGRPVRVNVPVLSSLGEGFASHSGAHGGEIAGEPNIGVVFFETPQMSPEAVEKAKSYSLIVTGSTWNEKILREYGIASVKTVIQGVDPTMFHPAPRLGVMPGRFLIFSGGKLELRKGQDLAMAAFTRFAKTHPEALLVTAWHSPWPQFARTLDQSQCAAPMVFTPEGKADVVGWASANGVNPDQILDLGSVPNAFMPPILREMDAALFPNRSEGGTNLVAMECMACGVPTILSANTGHMDLIEDGACYPLNQQRQLAGIAAGVGATSGWGESSVDEIVARLEEIYANRDEARRRGDHGARKLSAFTWAKTAAEMKEIVLSFRR
jgi:glycosyltransferase involved in cell wall biosynthesis